MVRCAGYWAFGNGVQPYLLNSLTNPSWAVTLANLFAIIQVSLSMNEKFQVPSCLAMHFW